MDLSGLDSTKAASGNFSSIELRWGSCPDDYFVLDPAGVVPIEATSTARPWMAVDGTGLPDFGLAIMHECSNRVTPRSWATCVNPGGPGGRGSRRSSTSPFPSCRGLRHRRFRSARNCVASLLRVDRENCADELDFAGYWTLELSPENQAQMEEYQRYEHEYQSDCERRNPAW